MKRTFLLPLLLLGLLAGSCCEGSSQKDEPVRNVIYMIGDGMGLAHVTMLKIENQYEPTAFDRAQNVALTITRSKNNRVTDSAAAGTALAGGKKTNNAMLGMTPDSLPVESMMVKAGRKGMQTGVVVTCYLQHATPGAFYAHVPHRKMLEAITHDMLSSEIDLLVGGGAQWLKESCGEEGDYLDAFRKKGYQVVETLDDLKKVDEGRVLAALADRHLPHAADRGDYLPEAVAKSLDILSRNSKDKGFLMMVEGSQIDLAAHTNDPRWLLDEMRDFDKAVNCAMDFADRTPGTLVVVVADHETGGLSIPSHKEDFTQSENGIHYDFGTKAHSASFIPVYLYGAGAERINGIIDNTDLAKNIMKMLDLE